MRLPLVPFVCSSLLMLAVTPGIADEAKSPQEPSLDAYISLSSGGSEGSILVSVKDGTSYKVVSAILHGLPPVDETDLHLSIRPTSKRITPPRTTGDPHAAIGISGDSAQLYVTDAVPLETTLRLCESLSRLEDVNDVVLRSSEPRSKPGKPGENSGRSTDNSSDRDPFGGPSGDDPFGG